MRQTRKILLGGLLALMLVGIAPFHATVQALPFDGSQQLVIPLYNYPMWWDADVYIWDDVAAANTTAQMTVIINPNNGPGMCPPNLDYQRGLADLQAAGVRIIGYVYTGYGNRVLENVLADVDLYTKCYAVDGIFFDEASSAKDDVGYYQELYNYVQEQLPGATVINNFGVEPDPAYANIGALMGVFEGEFDTFMDWNPADWLPTDQSVVFVHNTSADNLQTALAQLEQEDWGWFFTTSDVGTNPWDTLPTYFSDLVDMVAGVPEPGTFLLVGGGALLIVGLRKLRRV
jgi:hypothetical protein